MTRVSKEAVEAARKVAFEQGMNCIMSQAQADEIAADLAELALYRAHLLPAPSQSDEEWAVGRYSLNSGPCITVNGKLIGPMADHFADTLVAAHNSALAAVRAEATLAEKERCAKIADDRVEELIKRANRCFEDGDQESAIIERAAAQEARVIAAAIRGKP